MPLAHREFFRAFGRWPGSRTTNFRIKLRACQGDDTMTLSRHRGGVINYPYVISAHPPCFLVNFFIVSHHHISCWIAAPLVRKLLYTWRAATKIGGPRWRCSGWTISHVFSPSLRQSWSEEGFGPVLLFRASTVSSSV